MSERTHSNKTMKRWLRLILTYFVLAFIFLIIAGIVYEQIGQRRDRTRFAQIGRSVDIGGRALNIYCSGEGNPPVILEAPGNGLGYFWAHIQPEIAKSTKACWYDRAGQGWSDPGPYPQTSAAMAKDLHELLPRAGIPPPYVLVGFSSGGLIVRVYNGLYPNEVAGTVLVDSAHEDEPKRAPKFYLGRNPPRYLWYPLYLRFQTARHIGLLRLTQPSPPRAQDGSQLTPDQMIQALQRQPKYLASSQGLVLPESYEQARAAAGMGDRPLIVLTAGKPPSFGDPEMDRQASAYHKVWIHEMQARLVRLSTRGRQIVVENSDHGIPSRAPDVLVGAVREVVTEIRSSGGK